MSTVLSINNREYVPASKAGKHFGYTRDYILMLARDGKIDGKKIGHRWYVNLDSAKKYFDEAKVERDARKKLIREERKSELRLHQHVVQKEPQSSYLVGLLAIVVLSLVLTSAAYVSTVNPSTHQASVATGEASLFSRVAEALYGWFVPEKVEVTEGMSVMEVGNMPEVSVQGGAMNPTAATRTIHTSLVIGPDETMTITDMEVIRDSFSDEVSVSIDPKYPDTGIIIPHFKDGDGEAYRFLMVPVNEENSP